MTQFQHNAPEPENNTRGALQLFDVSGADIRFGQTEHGTPYAVAADFAKAMGYARTQSATDLLDEEEKGYAQAVTPGGTQRLAVIYEDGMWELIFRSTLPGAKAIKTRVKAILKEIRETGRYDATVDVPQDYEQALVHLLDKVRENKALEAENKVLAPKAGKWDEFLSAEGLIGMRETADLFHLDVRTLTAWLVEIGVFRKQVSRSGGARNLPRKAYQDSGHFEVKMETKNGFRFPVAYATGTGLDFIDDRRKAHAAA
ncbi:phage antirepressor KilAC domain-containing protein [Streptomyces fagopyri]|uniref:phage antirepressor KilAC domain-containing protein n=1 Tax=Streptomyces fagopyri TaxID=2662397 RepID=UPI001885A41B|nr:phage antirepressor KilAC domain-containing protein [Streptomyces fagopyri]